MFFWANAKEFNNHSIPPRIWEPFNHTSLIVHITIKEEFIQDKKWAIVKNNKKEKVFVNELRNIVGYIDLTNISNHEALEEIIQAFASFVEKLWYKYSKNINITQHSEAWWNNEYNRDITTYHTLRSKIDWIKYRNIVKIAKYSTTKSCYDQHLLDAAWIWLKGNDNMIGCAAYSSVSTSCSRCTILALFLCSMTRFPYVLQTLASWTICIYIA